MLSIPVSAVSREKAHDIVAQRTTTSTQSRGEVGREGQCSAKLRAVQKMTSAFHTRSKDGGKSVDLVSLDEVVYHAILHASVARCQHSEALRVQAPKSEIVGIVEEGRAMFNVGEEAGAQQEMRPPRQIERQPGNCVRRPVSGHVEQPHEHHLPPIFTVARQ